MEGGESNKPCACIQKNGGDVYVNYLFKMISFTIDNHFHKE